jgi:hypothetical protein
MQPLITNSKCLCTFHRHVGFESEHLPSPNSEISHHALNPVAVSPLNAAGSQCLSSGAPVAGRDFFSGRRTPAASEPQYDQAVPFHTAAFGENTAACQSYRAPRGSGLNVTPNCVSVFQITRQVRLVVSKTSVKAEGSPAVLAI